MNDTQVEKKYTIVVSIDPSIPFTLSLSTTELEVQPEDNKQLIEWTLDSQLAEGGAEFVDLAACKPGFEWLSAPPPSAAIFDKATRPKKDAIQMHVTSKKNGAGKGAWLYRLRVEYNKNVYETAMAIEPVESGEVRTYALVGSNPIIINR